LFVIDTKSCVHVLTVVDVIFPALYFFFLLKKNFRGFVMSAGAYLFLGIFVAAAVRPSFCKIR